MTDQSPPKNPLELALLAEIDAYLAASGIKRATFGRKICNDVNLLANMAAGREIKLAIADRIKTELAAGWARIKANAPPGLLEPSGDTVTKAAE